MKPGTWPIVMMTLMVGCGGDGATDATDAGIDARGANVAVTVHRGRRLVANADVLFFDAGGALAGRTRSDVDGRASGMVPAGGSLLVVDLLVRNDEHGMMSFYGLEDGDELVVDGSRTPWWLYQPLGAELEGIVVFPLGPAGTQGYRLKADCVRGGEPLNGGPDGQGNYRMFVYVDSGCPAGEREVVVVAEGGGARLGYLHQRIAIRAGVTTTLAGTWTAPGTLTATVRGIPSGLDFVRVLHAVTFGGKTVTTDEDYFADPVGVATATFSHPQALGDGTLFEVSPHPIPPIPPAFGHGGHTLRRYVAAQAPTLEIADLAAGYVPELADVRLVGAALSWTVGSGAPYDGIVFLLGGGVPSEWMVVLPPGTTSARLPTLPPDLEAQWAPVDGVYAARIVIDSHVGTYRDFRQTIFTTALDATAGTSPSTVRMWMEARSSVLR